MEETGWSYKEREDIWKWSNVTMGVFMEPQIAGLGTWPPAGWMSSFLLNERIFIIRRLDQQSVFFLCVCEADIKNLPQFVL